MAGLRKYKSLYSSTANSFGTGEGVTITPSSVVGLQTTPIVLTFDRVDSAGTATPSSMERILGTISGGNFVVSSGGRGYDGSTEQAHTSPVVEQIWNAKDWNDAVDAMTSVVSTTTGALDTTKVVDLTTAQTLTNKTLTTPKIATLYQDSIGGSNLITMPAATDTLVGKATTDTLTNKTLTNTNNNVAAKSLHSATTVVDVVAATAPSSGQVLTATDSTHATWQTPSASSFIGCAVHKSADQSINNNSQTEISWDAEDFDTDTMHDNSTNNGRLIAKTAGKFHYTGRVSFAPNSTGRRYAIIRKNGADLPGGLYDLNASTDGSANTISQWSYYLDLSINDYVTVEAVQVSGGALNVEGGVDSRASFAALVKVG